LAESNALVTKEAGGVTAPETTRGGIYYTPRVDIYESTDEVVLQCDMPGVRPKDIDIRYERGDLSLFGKVQPRQAPANYVGEEYGVGDFYRSFTIAPVIDADKIAAEYRDGVVTVHLPKQERVKPKWIAVQAS